jgi:hypothetical protein
MVSRPRWLALVGLAWSGIALGHLATGALVEREHDAMFSSFHSWVPFAAVVAIAAVPGLVAVAAFHAVRADQPFRMRSTAAVLGGIQLPLFVTLEVVERMLAPGPYAFEPGVLLGVMIQVVVVLLGVALLAAVVRAAQALTDSMAREPAVERPRPVAPDRPPAHLVLLVRSRRRAPPLSLAA